MGLYNFQKRFVVPILNHTKKHTIRATRRHPDKVGNIAHLYTGLRTKNAQLLGRFPITRIEDIEIRESKLHCRDGCVADTQVFIEDIQLSLGERETLARLDGFENFTDMAAFWKGRLPFKGEIVHWNPDVTK